MSVSSRGEPRAAIVLALLVLTSGLYFLLDPEESRFIAWLFIYALQFALYASLALCSKGGLRIRFRGSWSPPVARESFSGSRSRSSKPTTTAISGTGTSSPRASTRTSIRRRIRREMRSRPITVFSSNGRNTARSTLPSRSTSSGSRTLRLPTRFWASRSCSRSSTSAPASSSCAGRKNGVPRKLERALLPQPPRAQGSRGLGSRGRSRDVLRHDRRLSLRPLGPIEEETILGVRPPRSFRQAPSSTLSRSLPSSRDWTAVGAETRSLPLLLSPYSTFLFSTPVPPGSSTVHLLSAGTGSSTRASFESSTPPRPPPAPRG